MKVLYVASNPSSQDPPLSDRDITELQRTSQAFTDQTRFIFLPSVAYQDIEAEIARHKPDILHLAAHGSERSLWLSPGTSAEVEVTADSLKGMLLGHRPKLIYLNACHSKELAKELINEVPYAVGTTNKISNFVARTSSTTFYRCLLRGQALETAFKASSAIAKTLGALTSTETELFCANPAAAKREYFYRGPRLVAYIPDDKFTSASERFTVKLGILDADEATTQVVFCTDDDSFITDGGNITSDLCSVERGKTINGEIWLETLQNDIEGDFRFFALCITAGGGCYCLSSTICEALTSFYDSKYLAQNRNFPRALNSALAILRKNDGSSVALRLSRRP